MTKTVEEFLLEEEIAAMKEDGASAAQIAAAIAEHNDLFHEENARASRIKDEYIMAQLLERNE